MNKFVFVGFMVIWAVPGGVTAQNETPPLAVDSSVMQVRLPEASVLERFRNDPAYSYVTPASLDMTWWDELIQWLRDLLRIPEGNESWPLLWKILFYTGLAAMLFFGGLQLFQMDPRHFLRGRGAAQALAFGESAAPDAVPDLKARAEKAFEEGDYREGIRYYYLHILRLLDTRRVIQWHARKTNRDYLNECRHAGVKPLFGRLTYLFDYAWYGHFPVRDAMVEEMRMLAGKVEKTLGEQA